jgi:hypothetical protein
VLLESQSSKVMTRSWWCSDHLSVSTLTHTLSLIQGIVRLARNPRLSGVTCTSSQMSSQLPVSPFREELCNPVMLQGTVVLLLYSNQLFAAIQRLYKGIKLEACVSSSIQHQPGPTTTLSCAALTHALPSPIMSSGTTKWPYLGFF